MASKRPNEPSHVQVTRDAFRYAGMGMTFAVTVGLFALGGFFLDGRLGTSPLFLIVAVFLGFGLGLYSMVSKLPSSARKSASSGKGRSSDSE